MGGGEMGGRVTRSIIVKQKAQNFIGEIKEAIVERTVE